MKINNHNIGKEFPPYIIAEACINHDGKIEIAKEMVFAARAAGAHAIKFQMHVLDDEMLKDTPISDNFDDSLYNTLEKTNLSVEEHMELKKLCELIGIDYLCTPFSFESARILDEIVGVSAFKVGSGECTNLPLLKYIASKGKPMIVSTGMTEQEEVDEIVDCMKSTGIDFLITHCVSAYPCPYEIVNLSLIKEYEKKYNIPIGLSDHTIGIYTSLGSIPLGACLIEKHFSLDRTQKGPDHLSSIEPDELKELSIGSKAVWQALGSKRKIYKQEEEIVSWARESVVSIKDISKDSIINENMIAIKRPSPTKGVVAAKEFDMVVGKKALIDIKKDQQIKWDYIFDD
tara:strand:+ start:2571 stop:3605 length:1035 start_codon:yes stop_codon:yes gene_type:complete